MFKTRITEMLGIEYPILVGPMAAISNAEFVSAVSNAGGLGILVSVARPTPGALREEVKKTKSMTDKPFGVNITMFPRVPPVNYGEYMMAAIEGGCNIIETSGSSPEPYMKLLKDAGVKILHRATRTMDIRKAERVGVDAVTILGTEAGGSPGQEEVTSMVRIPVAVEAVKIPVIAAGGIADGRGFIAALALGAEAVLMGTRFMLSKESSTHPNVKKWLLNLTEADTILIHKSIKHASRVAKVEYTENILQAENKGASPEELRALTRGVSGREAFEISDFSHASITVGQAVGLIHDIPTVKEIIDRIINEGEIVMQRLNKAGTGR